MDERRNRYVRLPNEVFGMGLDRNEIAIYAYLLYCPQCGQFRGFTLTLFHSIGNGKTLFPG